MALNEKVRVTWGDLQVGHKLLWDIYTDSGKLLLKAGQTIHSEQVLEGMRKYVLFRYINDGETAHGKKQKRINVFAELPNLVLRLKNILRQLMSAIQVVLKKLNRW